MSEPNQQRGADDTAPMIAQDEPLREPAKPRPSMKAPVVPAPVKPGADDKSVPSVTPVPASSKGSATVRPARVRRARLRLTRIDPWSMMKTGLLFSIAGGIVFWIATYAIWGIIQGSGMLETLNETISQIVNSPNDPNKFHIEQYVSTNKVLGIAAAIAFVDIVLVTALATLGAFLYNLSATMLGGLEVTLAED